MRRRTNPYDHYKRHYEHAIDIPMPDGGWDAQRFRLLYNKANEIAFERHAAWSPLEPPNRTRFAFLLEADRDTFADWLRTCGVDWSAPNGSRAGEGAT